MKTITALAFFLIAVLSSYAQWNYPASKTVDSSDTYFGVTYKDPYRWLEHVHDSDVVNWFKQQSGYTNSIIDKISGKDELVHEWEKLDKLQPPSIHSRNYESGRVFYKKTTPGESVGKIYYREGLNGQEVLLFDPLNYIPGKKLSVQSALPSFDGKKIAIAYAEGGGEIATIIIEDVDTKKILPEQMYPSWGGAISWTFDSKALLYNSMFTGDHTSPEMELHDKTKLHKLGDDVKNDIDFFGDASYPNLEITPDEFAEASLDKDSRNYIFGYLNTDRNELRCYYAPISEFNSGKIDWKSLCQPKDKIVRGLEVIGDDVYAITYKDAPKYKLIYTSLKNPDWDHAKTIVPEKDETLEGITHSKNYLYLTYSENGIKTHIYKYNLATHKMQEIKLPFTGTAGLFCLDTKTDQCFVAMTSWNRPFTEFAYDADKNIFSASPFNKAEKYPEEYNALRVKEVQVKGHDGAMIPLSIIYKKGIKLDGSNCAMMEGYGSYGISYPPFFNPLWNALAVKGVVIAIAHIRGGSEKGEAWYKGGYKTTKPNTWKEFNSCAQYLIDSGYTSAAKLTGMGTSAGGILISRAITERPDLYGAAICNVGCANAMRMEFTPNGPSNVPEFGTVKDSVECKALYEMDGVSHVVSGTKYPAVLCVGGWNDPRVIVWQPGKFAAAVQNSSSSGKPVLMKINYDDGHFTEDKEVTYKNFAAQFAFALWQCGDPDFQLKQ